MELPLPHVPLITDKYHVSFSLNLRNRENDIMFVLVVATRKMKGICYKDYPDKVDRIKELILQLLTSVKKCLLIDNEIDSFINEVV